MKSVKQRINLPICSEKITSVAENISELLFFRFAVP